MRRILISCLLVVTLSAYCAQGAESQTNRSYSAQGVVEKIAPDLSKITIHHQTISNYMMEMTMDFNVRNTNELSGITAKDEITFTLVVTDDDEWVEKIHRIGRSNGGSKDAMSMAMKSPIEMDRTELKAGDMLPDYMLTAEDGRLIRVSDFRGKAVAFTFFFTRCPLPDYCPRMNTDFAQARSLLLKDASAPTNWQIISISFDPEFDTPKVLSRYARAYRGDDPSRWIFATGTTNALADAALHLDLMVMRQGGSITHNLRTVVLDTEGRIYRQFDGNEWTPQQLADAINQAARQPTR